MTSKKIMLAAVLVLSSLTQAEILKFDRVADWQKQYGVKATSTGLQIPGKCQIKSRNFFTIDPQKSYQLTVTARALDGAKSSFMPTIAQFDRQGRQIGVPQVKVIPHTYTTLLQAVNGGVTQLQVQDAQKWPQGKIVVLAFNAKADQSDLPNFTIVWAKIRQIQNKNGHSVVTLDRKVFAHAPQGSGIRVHANGGNLMYPAGGRVLHGQTGTTLTGKIQGGATANFTNHNWAPGAVKGQLIFHMNHNNEDATTEIKDITLKIQ